MEMNFTVRCVLPQGHFWNASLTYLATQNMKEITELRFNESFVKMTVIIDCTNLACTR